jgi:ELWxxDGT repeat protein
MWKALLFLPLLLIVIIYTPTHGAGSAFLVKALNTPPNVATANLVGIGNDMYFTPTEAQIGTELWKSNGTLDGTVLVKDINQGPASAQPFFLTKVNDTLFFTADDGVHGRELWKSNGTEAGTILVKDINPGSDSEPISDLTDVNGTLFFVAYVPATGSQLWKSDGTVEGTVMVTTPQLIGQTQPFALRRVNGLVFFMTSQGLWCSDGTGAGTILLKPGTGYNLTAGATALFFVSEDIDQGQITGYHLWESNGSPAGTRSIQDFLPQAAPSELVVVDETLFFVTNKSPTGMVLWRSDSTPGGTAPITTVCGESGAPYAALPTAVNGTLFFTCGAGQPGNMTTGYELWKSDGMVAGTKRVRSFYHADNQSGLWPLANIQGTVCFGADDGLHGHEFWKSDMTEAGTLLVQDIAPGSSDADPNGFAIAGSNVFFTADDGTSGRALWAIPLTTIDPMPPTATATASATLTPTPTALIDPVVSPPATPTPFTSSLQRIYVPVLHH